MATARNIVSLPPERFLQLQEVAEAFGGVSMATAIGRMVRAMADQGLVPHHLPGVKINALSDEVVVTLENAKPFGLTREGAHTFAVALRKAADHEHKFSKLTDHDYTVARVGQGVSFRLGAEGGQKLMGADLAVDLAELIEKAAEPTSQAA